MIHETISQLNKTITKYNNKKQNFFISIGNIYLISKELVFEIAGIYAMYGEFRLPKMIKRKPQTLISRSSSVNVSLLKVPHVAAIFGEKYLLFEVDIFSPNILKRDVHYLV